MKYFLVLITIFSFNALADKTMSLHPDFPIIEGEYQLTNTWSITLDQKYNRRIEDGSMVIWRPGVTIWIIAWGNDNNKSVQERMKNTKIDISDKAYEYSEKIDNNDVGKIQYFLKEVEDGNSQIGLNGFVFNKNGHLQISIYYDQGSDENLITKLFNSIKEK